MTIAPVTDRELSATLVGDYEALQDHVHRGHLLAADFQQHDTSRSNEVAVLSALFEKAQRDMKRLKGSIARLRQERHRLANEAMRALALERRLTETTLERDRLRAEGAAMRQGLIASAEETSRRKRETDDQLARMALELGTLRRHSVQESTTTPAAGGDASLHAMVAQIAATLNRVVDRLERSPSPAGSVPATVAPEPATTESIAIDFES